MMLFFDVVQKHYNFAFFYSKESQHLTSHLEVEKKICNATKGITLQNASEVVVKIITVYSLCKAVLRHSGSLS